MPKIITAFILFSTSIIVGLFAYLGSFSRLMADDFCSIYYVETLGAFRSVWYWYITWHGGFSASFADALLGFFGESGPSLLIPLSILVWVLSLTWTISTLLSNRGVARSRSIAVSAAMLVLYGTLINSPTASASIVWWGGLRGYMPPLIIMPLYIGLYDLLSRKDWSVGGRYLWYLLSFAITFFNGGFSENFTPLQLIILAFILTIELYMNRLLFKSPKFYFLCAGILGGILALVLMVMAPGNANRQAFYPPPAPPLEFMFIALKSYLSLWTGLFSDLPKIVTSMAVLAGSMLLGTLFSDRIKFNFRIWLMVIFTGLLFAYFCYLPAAYGQSTGPSDTSLIIPVYILMLTLVIAGAGCGAALSNTTGKQMHRRYILFLSLILFVSLGYSTMAKAQDLRAEITGATVYDQNWAVRDRQIRRARLTGAVNVVVPSIPQWITEEPIDNPNFFVNQCMALYYDVETLVSVSPND